MKRTNGDRCAGGENFGNCMCNLGRTVDGRALLLASLLPFARYLPFPPCSSLTALGNAEPQGLLVGQPWAPVEETQRDPARPQRPAGCGIARTTGIQGVASVPACGGSADPPTPAVRPNGILQGCSARVPPPLILLSHFFPPLRLPALEMVRQWENLGSSASDATRVTEACDDLTDALHKTSGMHAFDDHGNDDRDRHEDTGSRDDRSDQRTRGTYGPKVIPPRRAKWVGGSRIRGTRRTHRRIRLGRKGRSGRAIWIKRVYRQRRQVPTTRGQRGANPLAGNTCSFDGLHHDSELPGWVTRFLDQDDETDELVEHDPRANDNSGKPILRIGEAQNPGPRSARKGPMVVEGAAEYREPHRPGFHRALLPGDGEQRCDEENFQLCIDTVNATAWGTLKRYLRYSKAHAVLAQEHHLGPDAIAAASAWALRRGWRSVFAPALEGEGVGWRAGVAIFARAELGLSMPRAGPHVIIPGRIVAALLEAPGYRPCTLVSMYLKDGVGLNAENYSYLEAAGKCVAAQGEGAPFIVGGDMQMDPSAMAAAGFAAKTGATLIATRDPRGTCRSARATSELDYYFIQEDLATGIKEVKAQNDRPMTKPHVPVRITFHPKLVSARALTLRTPPKLSTEKVYGPTLPPPTWSEATESTKKLISRVRDPNFTVDQGFRDEYSRVYKQWADLAECEIINGAHHEAPIKKTGLRGREPELVWRSVLPERPPEPPLHAKEVDKWRTAAMLNQEIRAMLHWLAPDTDMDEEDDNGAADDPQGTSDTYTRDGRPDINARLRDIRCQLDRILDEPVDDDGRGTRGQDPGDEPTHNHRDIITRMRGITCAVEVAAAAIARNATCLDVDYSPHQVVSRLTKSAEDIYEVIQSAAKSAVRVEEAKHTEEWRTWVAEGIEAGARNAHRFLKLPVEWRPTTTLQTDGVITADPLKLLEGYAAKYEQLWNPEGDEEERTRSTPWRSTTTQPLQRPSPEEIRAASRTFTHRTAVTFDGIAMRHYDMLSDAALDLVADHIEIMERTGEMPPQLALIPMPMLEKPRGGHRAIANFASLYRLWGRIRRDVVRKWEQDNERAYFAAGKGRSPQDTVWRQAARAEAAVSRGQHSAALLWDLSSFFETIKREPLWHKARRLGFPPTVAKVAFCAYDATRALSIAGVLARPVRARNGVPAGCGMAMAFTRAYVIDSFDRVTTNLKEHTDEPAHLDVYVDDLCVTAQGTSGQVLQKLTAAKELLQNEIEGPLRCKIETQKAAVVASSRQLMETLRDKFGAYAGPRADDQPPHSMHRGNSAKPAKSATARRATTNLGIDCAPGCKRKHHRHGGKRAARLDRMNAKVKRLARIRGIAGKRTSSIFMAGPLPEAVYGAAVNGLSDRELLRVRRAAALAYSPRAKGRSLARLLLIVGIPTWRAEVDIILQYAKETWAAALLGHKRPETGQLTLAEISRLWHAVNPARAMSEHSGNKAWDNAKGPIAAMWLSLRRIGWDMPTPFTLTNTDGDDIPLTKVSPKLLAMMLKQAVHRHHQTTLGQTLAQQDPTFTGRRVAAEHIAARLNSDRSLTTMDKACYRAVACNAVMTNHRANQLGYDVPDICPMCGHVGDTMFHRIWKCCHRDVVAAREAAAPSWLLDEVSRTVGADKQLFWTTAFIPHPADVWPKPSGVPDASFQWHGDGGPGVHDRDANGRPQIQGQMYVDGSCTTGIFYELRRASTALVQWCADRPSGWRIAMPVIRPLPQTPQAAEYTALALVGQFRRVGAQTNVASDCANVVDDANAGPARALAPRRAYAGLMKETISSPTWNSQVLVRKVPAHVDASALPPGDRRDDAIGNNYADELAKEAQSMHPQPAPALVTELEAQLKRAKAVIRVIAKVTQCFPRMPKGRIPRKPADRTSGNMDDPETHSWAFIDGLWRCTRCQRLTLKPEVTRALAVQKCRGAKDTLQPIAIAARGHTLARTSGSLPIMFCLRCGAFAARRARGLAQQCPGRPKRSGAQALEFLRRGMQPWTTDGRRRLTQTVANQTTAWDPRDEAFRVCGATTPNTRRSTTYAHEPPHDDYLGDTFTHDTAVPLPQELDSTEPADNGHSAARGDAVHIGDDDIICGVNDPGEEDEEDVFGHGGDFDQPANPRSEPPPAECQGADPRHEPEHPAVAHGSHRHDAGPADRGPSGLPAETLVDHDGDDRDQGSSGLRVHRHGPGDSSVIVLGAKQYATSSTEQVSDIHHNDRCSFVQGESPRGSGPMDTGESGGPSHYDVLPSDASPHLVGDSGGRPTPALEVDVTNAHVHATESCRADAAREGPCIPIWMEDPAWLYLPHLQRRREALQPHGPHRGNGGLLGHYQQPNDQPGGGAVASSRGSHTIGEGDVRDRILAPVHTRTISPTVSQRRPASPAVAPIRGRGTSPGPRSLVAQRQQASRRDGRGELQRQAADADRYILSAALASHEERVKRRRLAEPGRALGPRPAERLAALRQRVVARASGDADAAAAAVPLLAEPANAAAVHHAAASSAWHDVALANLGPSGP